MTWFVQLNVYSKRHIIRQQLITGLDVDTSKQADENRIIIPTSTGTVCIKDVQSIILEPSLMLLLFHLICCLNALK